MSRLPIILCLVFSATFLTACAHRSKPTGSNRAESRAVEFLKREVPAWSRENGCYSCHNNGDAARALFVASQKGYQIPRAALADTIAWLTAPAKWDHNQGDPGFSDQRLADVQFAAALAAAIESGNIHDRSAMIAAAIKVDKAQADDGSWPIDAANPVGSPTTYGTTLATYMAWESLRRVSLRDVSNAQKKAEERLLAIKPDSVPKAAVLLLFLGSRRGHEVDPVKTKQPPPHAGSYKASLDFLRRAQTSDGGWGPYADSAPETFDTALTLLALTEYRFETDVPEMIQRGRKFLITTQQSDGSWPTTTRPSGGQSYAQQMSTAGWATLALFATR